jgi:hypothetical protein
VSRTLLSRRALVLVPFGVVAFVWLACGKVDDVEPTTDAGVVVGDAQCPDCGVGLRCVYDPAEGCGAAGKCIVPFDGRCPSTPDKIFCPCDASRYPPYVSGTCTTFYDPEEAVQVPTEGRPCFPVPDQ